MAGNAGFPSWANELAEKDRGGTIETQGVEQISSDNQLTWQVSNRNKLAFNFRADPKTQTHVGISSLVPVDSTSTPVALTVCRFARGGNGDGPCARSQLFV